MFNKYYQDELTYLRDLGREFSEAYPDAAQFIGERGSDPDVERLLEGFSFLTARIRQKLDDELPEFTHAMIEMFWPHYLRPIPSMSILKFDPLPQATKEARFVRKGVELDSLPVDGTACRFRTAYDTWLAPVTIQSASMRLESPPSLKLRFKLTDGVGPDKIGVDAIRIFLSGEPAVTRAIYLCLRRYVKKVIIRPTEGGEPGKQIILGPDTIKAVGFDQEDSLLPYPKTSFLGYRTLQEYFTFPEKFMFLDLKADRIPELGQARSFEFLFELNRTPEDMPAIDTTNFNLNCVPIVNLFDHEGDPIRVDHKHAEYKLRPGGNNYRHYDVYTIDNLSGHVKGLAKPREYKPFFGFRHSIQSSSDEGLFFRSRVEESVTTEGTDVYVSLHTQEDAADVPAVETISSDLTCTNRNLASRLRIGDISVATSSSPEFARFKNLTPPTNTVPPPVGKDIFWRLLSHLSLNYLSLASVDTLRSILQLYHFRTRVDRQAEQALKRMLDGIKSIEAKPATRMLEGAPIRGISIRMELEEDNFGGEGEIYLFSAMINEFFALYVTLNSFSQLTVKGLKYGEIHQWAPRIGTRTIL